MVYFVIPISCFDNYKDMIGKTSKEVDEAIWTVKEENKDVIIKMFKYFGICSWKHKHDVLSILVELMV